MQEAPATAGKSTVPPRVTNTRTRVLRLIEGARSEFPGAARFLGDRRLEALAEAIIRSSRS